VDTARRRRRDRKGHLRGLSEGRLTAIDAAAERIRRSFDKQEVMRTIGATLSYVAAGETHIILPIRADLTQQHGYVHAGIIATIADSACGYAALSLMEPGTGVLSVEFKINMLAPAAGERFLAIGRVVRSGRTITVCSGEVRVERDGGSAQVAMMQATMMAVRGREGVED
jgi:uncharacterized protein (TIGR00369 family)